MKIRFLTLATQLVTVLLVATSHNPVRGADDASTIDFARDVQPVLNRYCAGCHGPNTTEGELRLDSLAGIQAGGEHGPILRPKDADGSKMIQLISGTREPKMPPAEEPQPDAASIALLKRWIDAGAQGPSPDSPSTSPPSDEAGRQATGPSTGSAHTVARPSAITALAVDSAGQRWARGEVGRVVITGLNETEGTGQALAGEKSPSSQTELVLSGLPGKVTGLGWLDGGRQLVVAAGWAGSPGEVTRWDLTPSPPRQTARWTDHADAVYALSISRDGEWLATAGYDRKIVVRRLSDATAHHVLEGHNGAIFDLDFSPDGRVLSSASADATVKVWNVATGERLDTMSQPLKEQLTVDISPDGKWVAAAGEDNRVRLWQLVSTTEAQINPIHVARFAHEATIYRVRFSSDGRQLVSVAADQTIKVWSVPEMRLERELALQPASSQVLAIADREPAVWVGRMDGTWGAYELGLASSSAVGSPTDANDTTSNNAASKSTASGNAASNNIAASGSSAGQSDVEPNDEISQGVSVTLPMRVRGVIDVDQEGRGRFEGLQGDRDLYRFTAREGETWIFEVTAQSQQSPLDSIISILTADGQPVPRVQLQAVRDSYFTFRGKNSDDTGDFRLQNWEEMRLNQYVYANGEVVKLYHYPRGPDSGFNVYPNFGQRETFFDTTPLAHALNEPCYVVEAHLPSETLVANGLPIFVVPYENDDASDRSRGSDSRVTFTAPASGEYLVSVRDVRGQSGPAYTYELAGRRPEPGFEVRLTHDDRKVSPGTGVRFGVELVRKDGYEGPVRLEVGEVPAGVVVAGPLVVEAGHRRAWGTVFVESEGAERLAGQSWTIPLRAEAEIGGALRVQEGLTLGPYELDVQKSKIHVALGPAAGGEAGTGAEGAGAEPGVIEIRPGETVTAELLIDRRGVGGPIGFGSEGAVWNVPHGVFVDNTGLNGVLLPEGETRRTIFLTAEAWLEPGERWVFVEGETDGRPTSRPVRLRVKSAGGE
ncbi:MAG: c-type cytochrome domain-containing protein [Pirellulales bacterium]